jgi:glycosyltransferase involved in cell wall biosynthesis
MLPIRVLFHVTHLRQGGGIESSLLSWLAILDRAHYKVGLSIAFPTADLESTFRVRIAPDVTLHILGCEAWLSYFRNLKVTGRLPWFGQLYEELLVPQFRKAVFKRRIHQIASDYDLIIDYDMSLVRFSDGAGKPLIGISHFRFPERSTLSNRKYRALLQYYQRYHRIVAICDAMREGGRRLFPSLAPRFVTLYPGFDRDDIQRRAALPTEQPSTRPYLITVTRLEETQKDVTTLIRAFALLVRQYQMSEQLLIVGEGRHQPMLKRLSIDLGVDNQVCFVGFMPNPLPLMQRARLIVLSSKFEGLPTALIEGLMLSQILISTDCLTGPDEILNHGQAGLLVPIGDAQALANAIWRGLRDEQLRQDLQIAATAHAELFSVAAFHNRFNALVQQLGLGIDF